MSLLVKFGFGTNPIVGHCELNILRKIPSLRSMAQVCNRRSGGGMSQRVHETLARLIDQIKSGNASQVFLLVDPERA